MSFAVLALMLCVFCLGTAEVALSGILPEVAADLSVSIPSAGLLVTAYAVGVAVFGPLVTLGTLKVSSRKLMLGLMGVFLVGNALSAFAANYELLIGARLLTALSHGTFVAMAGFVAAGMAPPGKEASAIANISLGFNLANVLGVPLTTMIGQAFGWRMTFAAITLAAVLATGLVAWQVPRKDVRGGSTELAAGGVKAETRVLLRPVVLGTVLVTVLAQGSVFAVSTYISPLLRFVADYPASSVSLLLLVFGAGSVCGNFLGGRVTDRSTSVGVFGSLGVLTVMLVVFWGFLPVSPAVPVVLFLFGAAGFAIIPALQTRILRLSAAAPILALSANVSAFNLGNGFGAWMGGTVIELEWGVRNVLLVAGAITLVALSLAWIIDRLSRTSGSAPAAHRTAESELSVGEAG
ncbi:DHA1 family inner membrane transport protein [Actinopolyspora lacussalsi]|nr:DHA1 family inner membrane transport protein [Actinopolyspora lacussalsi]